VTVFRIATGAVLALLAALLVCPPALADADPASDVLLGENVFYPYDPPVSSSLQATLNAETSAAHRAHFPIRVALIATPVDLGAVPTFFGKPRQYAAFLDQEISFVDGKDPLLVVMPNGYGDAGLSSAARVTTDSLARPSAATGNALTQAAITAVRKLAAASGHPLSGASTGPATAGSGSGVAVPLAILAGVCAVLAAAIIGVRRRRTLVASRRRARATVRRR
jgi:hypothetical protein